MHFHTSSKVINTSNTASNMIWDLNAAQQILGDLQVLLGLSRASIQPGSAFPSPSGRRGATVANTGPDRMALGPIVIAARRESFRQDRPATAHNLSGHIQLRLGSQIRVISRPV